MHELGLTRGNSSTVVSPNPYKPLKVQCVSRSGPTHVVSSGEWGFSGELENDWSSTRVSLRNDIDMFDLTSENLCCG